MRRQPGSAVLPLLCAGQGQRADDPGLAVLFVAALEPGRTSWTLPLDAVRLGPADDATAVTAAQVRDVVRRIIAAGHWRDGDPGILVVFDAGYDLTRLAWLLADLPVEVLGRLRSDRVMYFPAPPRVAGHQRPPGPARGRAQARRSAVLARPGGDHHHRDDPVRHRPDRGLGRLHQRLASRAGWEDHHGELPVIEGTLIRLAVDHLPGDRAPNRCGCGPHAPGPPPRR